MGEPVLRRGTTLAVAAATLTGCGGPDPAPARPVTYVAVGASDTVGVGAQDPAKDAWVVKVFERMPPGSTFVRLGVSGSTAAQAVTEQLPKAVAAKPDVVTVWLAVNDINALVSPEDYSGSLGRILSGLERTGARTYVGNVPDLTLVTAYKQIPSALLENRVRAYNRVIDDLAEKHGAEVVDLFGPSQELARSGKQLLSSDGFHPSTEGYAFLARVFIEVMEEDEVIRAAA